MRQIQFNFSHSPLIASNYRTMFVPIYTMNMKYSKRGSEYDILFRESIRLFENIGKETKKLISYLFFVRRGKEQMNLCIRKLE